MTFKLIDLSTWKRKDYFDQFLNQTPCTYSITVNLDATVLMTKIKKANIKFYPVIIYLLAKMVNKYEEFRTAFNENGQVGVYDLLHPSYAYFQNDTETFTNIWTKYDPSFSVFYQSYLTDVQKYSTVKKFIAKPEPANIFTISGIPWISFTSLNLNIPKAMNHLLPIFTTGKYHEQNGQILLPLALQAHHAVCDGFHIARFVNELQVLMNEFEV